MVRKGVYMNIQLTKDRESNYQIIYPLAPSQSETYAAKQLKKYLFKITGAMLPEFQDNRHVEKKEIVIGYTNRGGYTEQDQKALGKEGFIIKTIEEKIFIIGSGVRGALYGVYTFLETYCGCRFYTNDFERVPRNINLTIPAIDEDRQIPVFMLRNSYWHSVSDTEISAKLKINGDYGRERFPAKVGGDVHYDGGFEHTIGWLSGQCPYGERAWVQPCLTSEETYKTVLGNVRGLLEKNPNADFISITQNDGDGGACKCEKCQAINEAEESEMGTMLHFVNRIAEELGNEYPNVLFDTFAYRFTRKPPKTIRPAKNVVVRLCSIECCFRHPLEECDVAPAHEHMESFAKNLREWSAIAPNLFIWNYTTDFTNFPVLFLNLEALRKDVAFFAKYRVNGVFEQGNIASLNGEFGELKGYILAKLLWDPYMSKETYIEYIREFIRDFYGAGANFIEQYLQMVLDNSRDAHFGIYFDDPTQYVYIRGRESLLAGKQEFVRKGTALFDAAEAAAQDDITLANIRRSRIQLMDYIDFTLRNVIEESSTEAEKKILQAQLLANNEKRFLYMRRYNVTHNHEFHSIDSLSDPDYATHSLLWKCPGEA